MDLVSAGQLLLVAAASILAYVWLRDRSASFAWSRRRGRGETVDPTTAKNLKSSPDRQPLQILYRAPDDGSAQQVLVDIIAVHGLGSNGNWSWTLDTGTQRVNWLGDADMLPAVVPKSRIMAYNYESRWHSNAPRTRLSLCGRDLIHSIHSLRNGFADRPIIFVGHSLGGNVIQHALLYADSEAEFRYLPRLTVGLVFLGTPFRGSKMQPVGDIAVRLLAFAGSHGGIIQGLKYDDLGLSDNLDKLCKLRDRLSIPTFCFFELYPTDLGRKLGIPWLFRAMVVTEASACIPGWPSFGLGTDHLKLNKFSHPEDKSFKRVSEQIKAMHTDSKVVIERRSASGSMTPIGETVPTRTDDLTDLHVGDNGIQVVSVSSEKSLRVRGMFAGRRGLQVIGAGVDTVLEALSNRASKTHSDSEEEEEVYVSSGSRSSRR